VSAQKTVIRSGDLARTAERSRLTNAILLSGPPGSGKTASVYAVAKELDFEIFEINAGSRRSARDMLEKVGDMTQNHLVHLLNESDDTPTKPRPSEPADEAKQNKLMSFFKGKPSKNPGSDTTSSKTSPKPQTDEKPIREQKQSLILLEEVDVLFEEDKQFWTGVLTLISQSRRPIIITCNDESLLPLQSMSLHAILRYQKPARDLAIDYLLLVAANEGHVLKRDAVSRLFDASGMDVRRSLMDLNFWCQIGVGSDKAGLDWILPTWPPERNTDENGDRMRVLSLNTYDSYMGWFNRDLLLGEDSEGKETEALKNTLHWWRLGIQDSEDAAGFSEVEKLPPDDFHAKSRMEKLDILDREMDYLDMRSSLDILSSRCQLDMLKASSF
jgi:DNA polymerase III delta prime subunit